MLTELVLLISVLLNIGLVWMLVRRRGPSAPGGGPPPTFPGLVERELARVRRHGGEFTVAYLGIDQIERVRQRGGPAAAERLLTEVMAVTREELRASDVVQRVRGTEIGLLLPATENDGAETVLQRILVRLDANTREHRPPLTFSVGATTCAGAEIPAAELLQGTYQLMYQVRTEGTRLRHRELRGPAAAGE